MVDLTFKKKACITANQKGASLEMQIIPLLLFSFQSIFLLILMHHGFIIIIELWDGSGV